MTIMVLYASIEGHTKKIAEFLEVQIANSGKEPILVDANEKGVPVSFSGVEKIILASSVHRRRHPPEFEKFLRSKRRELQKHQTLFLSVSLCAAFQEGLEEAQSYLTDMSARTGFAPRHVELVAGSLQYDKYHDYEAQVIRLVALNLRQLEAIEGDREFTDWDALEKRISAFLSS